LQRRAGIQAIPEHRDPGEPWQHLREQLHQLAIQFGEEIAHPRHIAAWMGETRD
jgi:hypothetical protein